MDSHTQTIDAFLDDIASTGVAPAGGTAAAVVGAMGASLCEMAAIHTLERPGFGGSSASLETNRASLRQLRATLLDLGEKDAETVSTVYSAPSNASDRTLVKRATGIPLTIARACLNVLTEALDVIEASNPRTVPDVLTGVYLVRAALRSAVFIVRSNLATVDDQTFNENLASRIDEIETAAGAVFRRITESAAAQVSFDAE